MKLNQSKLIFIALLLTGCYGWQPDTTITTKCRWEYGDKFDDKYCKKCNQGGCWWELTESAKVKKSWKRKHRHGRRG